MKKSNCYFCLFVLMIILWGCSFPINKVGLSLTSPTNFIEWRLIVATIAVFILALATKNLILPQKKDWPLIIAVGFFQMGLTLNFTTYGLSLAGAGKATFIVFTTPIWIILFNTIMKRKVTPLDAIGFIFGLTGTIMLVDPTKFRLHEYTTWSGEIALVLAALAWSIGIILTRHLKWHRPPLQLLFWQVLTATLLTIIYATLTGASIVPHQLNWVLIGALLYTGVLNVAIGYWLMVILSKNLPSSVVSFGLLFCPILSLILSHFFLEEEITSLLLIAVILILVGISLHIYSEKKTRIPDRDMPN